MEGVTTRVPVQLSIPGSLGFSLTPDDSGRLIVTAVESAGPNALALAGVRAGNELIEVDGQSVAGAPLMTIVPLLQAERSAERPLSLCFEAQLFASTPERQSAAGPAAVAAPPLSPARYGTGPSASAHLRSATAAISMARHTPPRSAPRQPREPGSSSKRIGQYIEPPRLGLQESADAPPREADSMLPPPPPPSTPPPMTGRTQPPVEIATEPSEAAIAKLRKLFEDADRDNSGDVSKVELILGLRQDPELCLELGMSPPRGDTERAAFEKLFDGIDKDSDNMVSFPELKDFVVDGFPQRQEQLAAEAAVAKGAADAAEAARLAAQSTAPGLGGSVGGLRHRRATPSDLGNAFAVPGGDYLPAWLGSMPSPSNSVHSEVMTAPSSSGWVEGDAADEEDEDNAADEYMERRLAEYSIVKNHRDRSPVEPTGVLEAMKQPMFLDHSLPLPDPTPMTREKSDEPALAPQAPYHDSVMERTCFIFSRKNRVRICAQRVVKTRWFEILVILLIFGNSATLAMYDPLEPDSDHNHGLDIAGKVFTVIFSVEMFLKIIAQGFILDPVVYDPASLMGTGDPVVIEGGYLRESAWNWLDFVVVVTGWADFIPGYKNDFGILRVVRVLRPLRAITAIKSMKALVSTLMEPAVLRKLANVCLLCSFVFVVFAIIAVNMFNGVLRSRCFSMESLEEHDDGGICSIDPGSGRQCDDGYFCLRTDPVTGEPNENPADGYVSFDNFILANFTIFVMLTLEGWTEIMYMMMDGYGTLAWVYFVSLICTGVFVVINLFLAVISMGYEEQCEKAHEELKLTEEAQEYLQLIVQNVHKALSAPASFEEQEFLRGPDAKTIFWDSPIDVHYPDIPREVLQLRKDTLVGVFTSTPDDTNDSLVNLETFRAGLLKFMVGLDAKQESYYESGNIDVVAELKRTTTYFKKQWEQFDDDESGTLNYEEVQGVLLAASIVCTQEQLNSMFDQMDEDASGEVDMQEFVSWWVNHSQEHGLTIDKDRKSYGVPIELPDPRIKKLLFVLTNPEARGNDLEFSKDMTARMYQCLDVSGDGKLSVQEVIEVLGTPPIDPNHDKPQPLERAVITKESLRGLNAWEVFRLLTLYTVERSWFNVLVTAIVLLNCTVLAMYHYGISDSMVATLEPINTVCTLLFGLEMCLKLIGMGFRRYASDTFNLFDGMLVIVSIIELAIPELPGVSVLRSLRIFRIMKLSSSLESFKRVILTILSVLPDLGNFAGLMALFVFFFSTMGLHLFGGRDPRICDGGLDTCEIPEDYTKNVEGLLESDGEVARVNFHDFGTSMVTVFQILTGEDWNAAMYSCMETYGDGVVIYFLSLTIIGTYVLLNLFLAVLILKTMEAFSPTVDPLARVLARYNRQFNPMEGRVTSTAIEQVILDGRALFLFGKHSSFRKNLKDIVNNSNFDNLILLCIVVSSIALAVEEPNQTPDVLEVISALDLFFTVVFTFECVIKILCMGLLCESKHTYLKNPWNVLDFCIVVAGLIDLAMAQGADGVCSNPLGNASAAECAELGGTFTKESEIKWVRTFRVLRALRPLRVIKRVPELKQVVNSLFKSIPTLANIAMVLVIFWLIFGILGVQMFNGSFYSCNDGDVLGMRDCCGVMVDADSGDLVEREWSNTKYGFDNIGQSVMTLFEVSTLEMWLDIMYSGMDATTTGLQPVYNNGPFMPLFFLIFIVFGSFFLLQLFAGAIVNEYNTLNEQAGGCAFQSARQKRMVNKLVLKHKSELSEPDHDWQRRIVYVTKLQNFRNVISMSIVLNVLAMALTTNDMSKEYADAIELANNVFTFVFAAEAGFKLLGLGGCVQQSQSFPFVIHLRADRKRTFVRLRARNRCSSTGLHSE
jgi:Ca2+-binding EF-hand superfamily protein